MSPDRLVPGPGQDAIFRPLGIVGEPVHRQSREAARPGYVVYSGAGGFEVAIPQIVVERMVEFGRRAAPAEWYGLLVGRVCEDAAGRHVVILGIVPDPDAEARHSSVRTSFESELRSRASATLLFPDGIPVGWVHGHVRHGARYSGTDFQNQATWSQPHSVGVVVDPWSSPRLGVYRGPEGELLHVAGDGVDGTEGVREKEPSPPVRSGSARRRAAAVGAALRRRGHLTLTVMLLAGLLAVHVQARRFARTVEAHVADMDERLRGIGRRPIGDDWAGAFAAGGCVRSAAEPMAAMCIYPACFEP